MSDQPKPTSERARKRALGKILREELIKRREAYFDLLVSGYSVEQIASRTKKSPSAVRRAVSQALANRRLDAAEGYARLQVARLTKALRCADISLEAGDLKAIAPFLKVVRELNLYHGVNLGPARPAAAAPPEIAPTSPPLALTHSPGAALTELSEDEKSCVTAKVAGVKLRGAPPPPRDSPSRDGRPSGRPTAWSPSPAASRHGRKAPLPASSSPMKWERGTARRAVEGAAPPGCLAVTK